MNFGIIKSSTKSTDALYFDLKRGDYCGANFSSTQSLPTHCTQSTMQSSTLCVMLTTYDVAQRCFAKSTDVPHFRLREETIISCTQLLHSSHPHIVLKHLCSQAYYTRFGIIWFMKIDIFSKKLLTDVAGVLYLLIPLAQKCTLGNENSDNCSQGQSCKNTSITL